MYPAAARDLSLPVDTTPGLDGLPSIPHTVLPGIEPWLVGTPSQR